MFPSVYTISEKSRRIGMLFFRAWHRIKPFIQWYACAIFFMLLEFKSFSAPAAVRNTVQRRSGGWLNKALIIMSYCSEEIMTAELTAWSSAKYLQQLRRAR